MYKDSIKDWYKIANSSGQGISTKMIKITRIMSLNPVK